MKAFILWNFVLSIAVALQKFIIQAGLKGLLPGQFLPRHPAQGQHTDAQQLASY